MAGNSSVVPIRKKGIYPIFMKIELRPFFIFLRSNTPFFNVFFYLFQVLVLFSLEPQSYIDFSYDITINFFHSYK